MKEFKEREAKEKKKLTFVVVGAVSLSFGFEATNFLSSLTKEASEQSNRTRDNKRNASNACLLIVIEQLGRNVAKKKKQ